jgi:hypothetical protein
MSDGPEFEWRELTHLTSRAWHWCAGTKEGIPFVTAGVVVELKEQYVDGVPNKFAWYLAGELPEVAATEEEAKRAVEQRWKEQTEAMP